MTQPTSPSPSFPQQLLELLERQHALVSELAALAQRQAQLIAAAQTDQLLALLTRRQVLIDAFTGSQERMHELTGAIGPDLVGVDDADRGRIESLLEQIGSRLSEVMERDEHDQQALEAARGRTRREMSSLDSGRMARRAYVGNRPAGNRFADEQG